MLNSRIILTAFLTIGTVVLVVPIVPDGTAGAGTPEGGEYRPGGSSEPGLPVRTRQLHNDTTQGPHPLKKTGLAHGFGPFNVVLVTQVIVLTRRFKFSCHYIAKLTYSERIIYLRKQSSLPEKYKDAAAALIPVGSGSPTM
ncbi:uncharacterized protein C8R40DRAFT_1164773 [Lentinula edodes]|uniref:uncharacterized protein n=1 Tax=Lentinula edodes TaxID=5353 RepID=UPI001E8DD478|nr:uncharacterized protein C8R40DRAFT_1164773 [Lentinula edodes]KAH7881360.1 hypothetical protein C8R40DRAFT_1164773 [Lentinula edodes]